jgi:hypothetical protein
VSRTLPPGFLRAIETVDRERAAERARAALTSRPRPAVIIRTPASSDTAELNELRTALELERAEHGVLHASLAESRTECDEYVAQIDALEAERARHLAIVAELEQERDALRLEIARAPRAAQGGSERQIAALRAAFCTRDPTLEQALVVLEALLPDRVEVLASAYASARRSFGFTRRDKAWELLWKLATEWWDAMKDGGGDDRARHVFTQVQYAARESKSVETNRAGRERRTFVVDGAPVTMWRHLKIGVKDSLAETWRCHFEWLPDQRRIVIGHCGGHLDFA